ncbi:helix-hairpin-helix domain-containing protein [Dactylosporangium sp. CA-139066]|uniref:helix-hairpin-helix domain-containing protein n=1 Tax=Dactylosporangium sp. CA-139066 TaxID=3239930 RepID=UPI003D8F978B
MWRSDEYDDGRSSAARLARVTSLPPDESDDSFPWDASFRRPEPPPIEPDNSAEVRGGGLGAFDPGRRGVRVLLAVAGLVVLVSAGLVWWSRPRVTPAPQVSAAPVAAPGSSAAAVLIVSVTGRVHRPGLVRLPAGSRVADAIEAAGGVLPGVDLTGVNLARKVVDGEMIAIGITPPPGAVTGAGGGGGTAGGPVNLNTATTAELQTLPGIGEVLAQRIVEYRDRHGGFRAVTDLRQVEGIGDAKFQQLKDRVTV